jgi:hypothetical protein
MCVDVYYNNDNMVNMFNDKHYLAMLAIPVLLSMTLGITGNPNSGTSLADSDRDRVESEIESADEPDVLEESKQYRESPRQNGDLTLGQSGGRDRGRELQTAIETANYESFVAAIEGTPFAEIMTPESFSVLVQEYHHQRGFSKGMYYDIS